MPLTPEKRKELFVKISELSGDNEEVMSSLAELQQDDAERDSNSNTYGDSDVMDADGERWDKKYHDLQSKYRERFFTPDPTHSDDREEEDTPKPSNITFDDLFE